MTGYNTTQNQKIASRAIIGALMLWLVFCGMAAAEQFYVNESGWWRDGGAFNAGGTQIQAAVGAAAAGDAIYVHGGNYNENVDVDKPRLTLEGEGADAVTVASAGGHVFKVTADYVNISGFTVTGTTDWYTDGFCLDNADYCNIFGNNAGENRRYGIYLDHSNFNTLTGNTANSNKYDGIYMDSSSNNTLTNNNALNNAFGIRVEWSSNNNTLTNNTANSNDHFGIRIHSSSNNTLTNNTMSGNAYNFDVVGSNLSHYTHSIGTSNIVDEKPIYYWVDRQDKGIPDNAGFVGVVDSTNITVRDLTLTKNGVSVLFAYTRNSRIENVTTNSNWYYGIFMDSSSNNTLTNNTANSNSFCGIWLQYSSNNTLTNNIASDNSHGIYLYPYSSNNTLTSNTANSNDCYGIYLSLSSNNTLTNNTANSNDFNGVYLYSSSNNTLTSNTVSLNTRGGIQMCQSNNNNIVCNWVHNNTNTGFHLNHGSTDNDISYNNIIENGNYNTTTNGWAWQFYNDQPDPVEAKHNYWGAGMNNSTIDASIYDDNGGMGKVEFYPFETEPAPCAPTPEESHTFTTTDAAIALQIAAGSRPPDLQWDVSGDGSVTSLDALMILQAAAGGIEIG